MSGGFNPLKDLATFLGSLAEVLPPLPLPPFPLPKSPPVESPGGAAEPSSFLDTRDPLIEAGMERYRAEQEARGIILLRFE